MRPVRKARSRWIETSARYGLWVLTVALPLIAWQVATSNGAVSPLVLPPPGEVWDELGRLVGESTTYEALRVTLTSVLVAAAIAVGAGVVVGAVGGVSRFVGELIEPVLAAASAVPVVMAFPLCVFIFGIDEMSKIAFAALYGFFPAATTTLHALRAVDPAVVVMARSMGASPAQLARKILIPAALPAIKVGIGMALVLAYLAVVAGEMLTSRAGAGNELVAALDTYQRAEGYAWVTILVVLPMAARALVWTIARADLGRRRSHVDVSKYAAATTNPGAARHGRIASV